MSKTVVIEGIYGTLMWLLTLRVALALILFTTALSGYLTYMSTTRRMAEYGAEQELIPYNQLERFEASHQQAVDNIRQIINHRRRPPPSRLKFTEGLIDDIIPEDYNILQYLETDIAIVDALGYHALATEMSKANIEDWRIHTGSHAPPPVRQELILKPHVTPDLISQTFCFRSSYTPLGAARKVDPQFCHRLLDLLADIQNGVRPPLLTLFTWLPDPLTDPARISRRMDFVSLDMFFPFVQPVLFTDHRWNMAAANSHVWPCLPVPELSKEGLPVFKSMAEVVMKRFPSIFYGYVSSTTIFDVSLLETLLAILTNYSSLFAVRGFDKSKKDQGVQDLYSFGSTKPVLVYGKALNMTNIKFRPDFGHLSHLSTVRDKNEWDEKKESLVYVIYSGMDFHDIPPVIVDDKYLTPFLFTRSMAFGHVTVDASYTLLAIHNHRNSTKTEWGKYCLKSPLRDPYYNRRMAHGYLDSLKSKTLYQNATIAVTRFGKDGTILFEARNVDSGYI